MSKKALPLAVEIDEVALSVLGWEIASFQARLVADWYDDDDDDDVFYEVAASMELRFHPDDWQVRHAGSSDFLPNVIWQLRSRTRGPLSSYQCVTLAVKSKAMRAPKLVSERMQTWEAKYPLNPDDLYIWVGGFDWDYTDGSRTSPGLDWVDVPIEVLDHTTLRGVRTEITELSARIRDGEQLEVTARAIHPIGNGEELMAAAYDFADWSVDPKSPVRKQDEFEVTAPQLIINVFDVTGFLLGSRETQEGKVTIGEGGVIPPRPATSITAVEFRLRDLSDMPARVVVRLQDPVE